MKMFMGECEQIHIAAFQNYGEIIETVLLKPLSSERVKLWQVAVSSVLRRAGIGRRPNQFANDALHKDAAQLKSYWSVQVFSGMSSPPDFVEGDKAVKQWVAQITGYHRIY